MKAYTSIFLVILSCSVFAQQDPLHSLYMLNPVLLNPAYSGINNNMQGQVGYRTQWTGFEGQPQTLNATIHSSFVANKVGAGISVMNDRIGNVVNTEVNASFSYKLELGETTFSFGMQAGLQNFRTDNLKLNLSQGDDYAFTDDERGSRFNIGAGAILKSDQFFLGLSIPRLLPTTFKTIEGEFELYNRHFYMMAGYLYQVNEHIRLKPTLLLRGVKGSPASVDFAFNVNINEVHTAGLFTRNLGTYGILLQTVLQEKYRFGYAFEMPSNKSVGANFSTHEISIGFALPVFRFHKYSPVIF
jgi:type IX secretion system PorP/SprF family membrane protein